MYYNRPELEKGSRTYNCPKCDKNTLKRYVLGGKYIYDTVGRCNREISCGYHKRPREYWMENNIRPIYKPIAPKQNIALQKIKPIDYIPMRYVYNYAKNRNNNLIYYLLDWFDWETIKGRTDPYFLGSAKDRAVIYWQIDNEGKCRTGKIQQIDKYTGKRIKGKGAINWVHDKLKWNGKLQKDFNLKMSLFGLHLIKSANNAGKTICICESEKSAIIAACCEPGFIWMAAGALRWLSVEKLKPLKGWNIILFPDTSTDNRAFGIWAKIAEDANKQGLNVIMADILENNCTDEEKAKGFDIADYLIRILPKYQKPMTEPTIEAKQTANLPEPQSQSDILSDMINKNPVVATLISTFDCIEV